MIVAILIAVVVMCIVLEGFFSYKQYWWCNDSGDKTPFGVWISCMLATGVLLFIALALLIARLL